MKQTKFNLTAATLCLLPVFFIQSVSGGSKAGAPFEVVQVWSAGSENGDENVTPTNFDPTEVEALKAIATANPGCTDLQEFIASEGWKENREETLTDNIGVKWDNQNPAHIERLFIIRQYRAQMQLDLSAFKFLKSLNVKFNESLSELDLSQQTALESLVITGTTLSFSKVKFANNIQLDFCGYSSSMKVTEIGIPIDDYTSLVASGTEIDLSSEASINGQPTTYQWHKIIVGENNENTSEPANMQETSTGKFMLEGQPGEIYHCSMTNPAFSDWTVNTVNIKIARSCTYHEQDINGLKKLAADNPSFTKLKEFVDSKGWELENWNTPKYQDEIKTDWKVDNGVARLTHLYVQSYSGGPQGILKNLDVSAFDELQHLECEDWNQITSLDLSKNKKLEVLRIYTEKLETLDVSSCLDLKELTFRNEGSWAFGSSRNILASLDISKCTKLTKLQIVGSPLTNLDISKAPLLETLYIENCKTLKIEGNINSLEHLQELGLNYTTQFEQYTTNLPESVIRLRYMGTDYPLPDDNVLARLTEFDLPLYTKSFDLTKTPQLRRLFLWKTEMRFSTLKRADNMSDTYQYSGESCYVPTGSSQGNWNGFKKGDKIDLSSEAEIDGKKTTYIWLNRKYNVEDTETFIEDPEHPGIFTVSQNAEGGDYTCYMGNPWFTSNLTINSWGGWRVRFEASIEGEAPKDNFSESDVMTLKKIVDASSSDLLKSWWSEGAWQKDDLYNEKIAAAWNLENPRRLVGLTFMNLNIGLDRLDVSNLNALKDLICIDNSFSEVILPKNTTELNSLTFNVNPITTLIISPYVNLQTLSIQYTDIKNCDLSNNRKLQNLYCNGADLTLIEDLSIYPDLKELGVPTGQKTLNLQTVSKLTKLFLEGSNLKFSDIQNPRQLENMNSTVSINVGNISGKAMSYGSKMDCSAEMNIGGTASQITWSLASDAENALQGGTNGIYNITDQFAPGDKLTASITNSLFPGWTLKMETIIYSCAGDANLDKSVNVQDITASVSEILKDTENQVTPFGELEADVNEDGTLDVADVVGIVGIIQDKPVVKNMLRSDYTPVVRLSTDEKGFLYMDAPVAIAGIQLTLTGVKGTLPLLGEAGHFVQTSMAGDTLRMLAYSADGTTLSSGKSVLMQLPEGARLISAVFSDVNARSLKSEGEDIATSSEVILPESVEISIRNYPNPFHNTTTFLYTLKEDAQDATIQIFSANGALVKTLNGLPVVAGQNAYPCTLSLPAGVYYYRLSVRSVGNMNVSKSNLFIIK